MKILVVGGGTAGLISAMILKKFTDHEVDVVYSSKVGIIGVGEGSTEHFSNFMRALDIDHHSIVQECDATYKCGIMFKNWTKDNSSYLHSVGQNFNKEFNGYSHVYAKQIAEQDSYVNLKMFWDNEVNKWYINKNYDPVVNQYHFNTYKLNEFLTKRSKNLGIGIFDDDILDVVLNENGEIDHLLGEKQKYDYDFYIDSTGMKRMLMTKLGAKWNSFGQYLKMKAAITFPTRDEDNYNIWTLAQALDYGWMFRLPVWGRHGNGYIFDSDYISEDKAKEEVDKLFGYDVEIGKTFKFDPGYLDQAWMKNCVAIGLSGSFVEPLEATSIGTTIQQSFLLAETIGNPYSENEVKSYNDNFTSIMENIRDFIVVHYITDKDSSQFWKDIKNIKIPDSLQQKMEVWKKHLPISSDFNDESNYKLFNHQNYILVLNGINWFDVESIKKEYDNAPEWMKDDAYHSILAAQNFDSQPRTSHKTILHLIREYL